MPSAGQTPADVFLSRVHHVRPKGGGGWTARCPAHDDRSNSLSIDINATGDVLLRCFVGCEFQDIVRAADLSASDLFVRESRVSVSSGSKSPRPATVAAFAEAKSLPLAFLSECGFRDVATLTARERSEYGIDAGTREGILIPYRLLDGSLAERHRLRSALVAKDGSFWVGARGGQVVPYGLDLWGATGQREAVAFCEGETDALAMQLAGLPAIGIPGANVWNCLKPDHVRGVTRAYVMQDGDPAGLGFVERGRAVLAGMGIPEVYAVRMPVGCKDVLDLHRKEGAAGFKAAIVALMKAAREAGAHAHASDAGVNGAATAPAPPVGNPVIVCMADVEPEDIEWIWLQRLARGKLTLLVADGGLGKSTITTDIAARITRGSSWPDRDLAPLGNVVLLTAEDGLADTVRPRLDRHGADARRVFVLTGTRLEDGTERHFSLDCDLPSLRAAIQHHSPVIVILDPLSAYFGTAHDSYKDTEVRAVLAPLVALAEQTRTAILGVMHLTKASQQKALHRTLGSVAFNNTARIVLAVGRDPDHESRCYLMPVKQNICAPAATLAYSIGTDQRLTWDSDPVTGVYADAILGGGPRLPDEDRDDAAEFLRGLLADGPMTQPDLEKAARAAGFSMPQMRRARKRAGVAKPDKTGFRGGWLWRLQPSENSTPCPEDDASVPKMTLPCEGVIFGKNEPISPFESTPFSKMTGVSSSASSSASSSELSGSSVEPLDGEWGEP